ncbi:hypothetical protein Slin15195_G011600 [Septoria linicola]|uniref:Uncharacterized protein n=1 Tax=Septoria linicola TaxID=215465 RepID=A0A9Q9AKX2_9PEZI|nr:hypothetical protein Slin14017_G011610 [Septoria linicola]USW47841.1 hypothetical protein Slin15195_G011600 [Septoria linicola]
MSGNNNITVAFPGRPNWSIWWQAKSLDDFQLDIVGFLAVLGEGAVQANAQVSALSRLFLLPRLLPAPQALIRTTRPTELPPTAGKVTGVYSGNVKDHVHHIANILLHPDPPLASYTVRCVEIKATKSHLQDPSFKDRFFRGQSTADSTSTNVRPPLVKAKATGPQTWVTLLGFFEALVLLIASITFGDGMSVLATISLSLVSTMVGISNKWSLRLPKATSNPTPGDVVIRYPNGSYLVVKCEEEVARALYFAPEEIDYYVTNPVTYRLLSLSATILLMLGIVFLANAKLQLQFGWAGAYVVINIAHWIAAALPQRYHWDLSGFSVREQSVAGGPVSDNFTEALWKAILLTKSVQWVEAGGAAPQTSVWKKWLWEAEDEANKHHNHVGDLLDPVWPGEKSSAKGIVWYGPDKTKWDPKEEWNKLNRAEAASSDRMPA